jgi:hypothetical protein
MKHPQCISVADGISGNADKVYFVFFQKAFFNKINTFQVIVDKMQRMPTLSRY